MITLPRAPRLVAGGLFACLTLLSIAGCGASDTTQGSTAQTSAAQSSNPNVPPAPPAAPSAAAGAVSRLESSATDTRSRVNTGKDAAQPYTVTFQAGWNLFAMPLSSPDVFQLSPQGSVLSCFSYNASTGAYVRQTFSQAGFAGTTNPYQGYWVFCTSPANLTLNGNNSASNPLQSTLQSGWNLVGTPVAAAVNANAFQFNSQSLQAAANSSLLGNQAFAYSPSTAAYTSVSYQTGVFSAFQASWVFAFSSGTLSTNNGPPPSRLYANDRSGNLWVIDPTTMLSGTAPISLQASNDIAYDTINNNVFLPGVNGANSTQVMPVVSASSFTNTANVTMANNTFQPAAIATDPVNGRVYTSDVVSGLQAFSTSTLAPIAGSPFKPDQLKCQGVVYESTHNRVYTCTQNAQGRSELAVYNATTMTQIPGSPFNVSMSLLFPSMIYDSTHDRIAISANQGNNLIIIDCTTLQPIAGSPFNTGGGDSRGMAYDAKSDRIYVCNFGSNSLAAFTGANVTALPGSPFTVGGSSPNGCAYSGATNRVYITNFNYLGNPGPGGIDVFDASTMTPVAGSPFQFTAPQQGGGPQVFVDCVVGP